MADDRNEADRILGEGWIDRGFRRYAEAWIKHPQRELLDAHKRDVDEDGMPRWHAVRELHEDGWPSTGSVRSTRTTAGRAFASAVGPRRSRRTSSETPRRSSRSTTTRRAVTEDRAQRTPE